MLSICTKYVEYCAYKTLYDMHKQKIKESGVARPSIEVHTKTLNLCYEQLLDMLAPDEYGVEDSLEELLRKRDSNSIKSLTREKLLEAKDRFINQLSGVKSRPTLKTLYKAFDEVINELKDDLDNIPMTVY